MINLNSTGFSAVSPIGTVTATAGDSGDLTFRLSHTATVTMGIPKGPNGELNATWTEIDICVNGTAKKAKVLMSDTYD